MKQKKKSSYLAYIVESEMTANKCNAQVNYLLEGYKHNGANNEVGE